MSTPDQPGSFAAGFMDDYFAEAEEHLVSARRSLLRLEAALGGELPAGVLDDLFRSFHSLKGISAMVELREVELLAHHMESCLRAIREARVTLTSAGLETLVDGAKLLEQVVFAHRNGTPPPPVARTVIELAAFAQQQMATAGNADASSAADTLATQAPRATVWKVTFTPSPELIARGVKVDTVRSRLLEIGHVLKAAPKVVSHGVSFEFDVATDNEAQLAAWRDDGIAYERLDARTSGSRLASDIDPNATAEPGATGDRPHELASSGPTNFVRVDLVRLDDLMRLVGDMVVTRARLENTLDQVERHVPFREWRALQEHSSRMERQLRDLREGVMRVRLVPVGEIFRRMPFVVRDLARDSGKRVRLDLAGQGTEIDKFLIERMMDPVLHLVRNAISHAIETPDERTAAGKPAEGTIRLVAATAGESVVLEIGDDGRGIDAQAVAARARAAGLVIPDGPIEARTLLDIICTSGFSTREEADRASGRGVGMAVVRNSVEDLGGTLEVETTAGRGTTFRVTLPLTLAITDAIITQVGTQTFAVPQSTVNEVIEVDASALRSIERNELLTYRGDPLPMVRLSNLFGIAVQERPRVHALVVGTGRAAVGLIVDRITGQREVVVKTITDPLIHTHGVSGATELGDGRLVLILDVSALSRALRERPTAEGIPA